MRQLWRQTAYVSLVTGLAVAVSLLGDFAFGINQALFRQAQTGVVEPLVNPHTHLDYAGLTLAGVIIFLPRLYLGLLTISMLRHCLIHPDHVLLQNLFQMAFIGGITAIMMVALGQFTALFYSQDQDRYLMVMFIKVGNFLYSIMTEFALAVVLFSAYYYRRLSRALIAMSSFLLMIAFIYNVFASHPDLTQFFGALITYVAALIIAMDLLLASRQLPNNLS